MNVRSVCGLAVLVAVPVLAQTGSPLMCSVTAGIPPVIRAEGQTELAGDLVLTCMGGSGLTSPVVASITIYLNTKVTSPVTDPVLLINDPRPATPGVNMFRGVHSAENAVTFSSVPVPVPPTGGTTLLRVTNLWADASSLPPGTPSLPAQLVAFLSIDGGTLALNNPQHVVGYVQPGYKAELRTPADGAFTSLILNGAAALNPGLLTGNGAGATPQYLVKFTEGFHSAFKPRATSAAGEPIAAQNVPGDVVNTESGLYDPSLPVNGQWLHVGLANGGTRLRVKFSGIPAGALLLVSATPWPVGSTQNASQARLTATGTITYNPVPAPLTTQVNTTAVPLAAIPVTNGLASAEWEIVNAPPTARATIESLSFAVFLAYPAGTQIGQTGLVAASLAPVGSPGDVNVPRFSATAVQSLVATVPPAPPPADLVPNLTVTIPSLATGAPVFGTASVSNQGQSAAAAPSLLRVQLYSQSTPVSPAFDCSVNGGLPAGATSGTCNWLLTAPPYTGLFSVRATADAGGVIAESDETNNAKSVPITVGPCTWTVSRKLIVLPPTAGTTQIAIETNPGCDNPIGQPAASWAFIPSATGKGPGIVNLRWEANPGAARGTNFNIAGQSVQLDQAAAGCTYAVTPSYITLSSRGETKTVHVNTAFGCSWAPETMNGTGWLTTVASSPLFMTSETIALTAPKNTGATREAELIVTGNRIRVVQFSGNDTTPPIGVWDTPATGTTGVTGAIPVTGWALDNTFVSKVQIWRDPVVGESPALVYVGDATFVDGARPDVVTQYPLMPYNTRAGWGYNLLTNMLANADGSPGRGNGTYTLRAIAIDDAGNSASLGSKTITCTNAAAVKPFGTIDTPASGETVSGVYANFAWALTPMPHNIPTDASTIWVYVDGKRLAHPTIYGDARVDIAMGFPGYANTNASIGAYYLNTKTLANGVHTIAWSVTDSAGRVDGIGSRYFEVNNPPPAQPAAEPKVMFRASAPVIGGVLLRTGYDPEAPLQSIADAVEVEQMERIELHLPSGVQSGCLVIGDSCTQLPAGSTLDGNLFYWQIGAPFLGDYDLRFDDVAVRVRVKSRY